MARLQEFYRDTVTKNLMEQFSYKSVMEVPRISKITLNMGVGEAVADKKVLASGRTKAGSNQGKKIYSNI